MGANSARQMEQASIKNSDNMSFIDDFRLLMEALIWFKLNHVIIKSITTSERIVMDKKSRVICMLAYLLFFIPLLVDKDKRDYRHHANQGLVLLIFTGLVIGLGLFIPVIGWFIILPFGSIFSFILLIIGMWHGLSYKTKELPLIGKVTLIK